MARKVRIFGGRGEERGASKLGESKLCLPFPIFLEVKANLMRARTEMRSMIFVCWKREKKKYYFLEISS